MAVNRFVGVGRLSSRPQRDGGLVTATLSCDGTEVPVAFEGPRAGVLLEHARPGSHLSVVGKLVSRANGRMGVKVAHEWEFVNGVDKETGA